MRGADTPVCGVGQGVVCRGMRGGDACVCIRVCGPLLVEMLPCPSPSRLHHTHPPPPLSYTAAAATAPLMVEYNHTASHPGP